MAATPILSLSRSEAIHGRTATADLLFRKKPSVEDYQQSRVVAFARIRTDGGGGQNGKHTKNSND
jgi:hypothetical protein